MSPSWSDGFVAVLGAARVGLCRRRGQVLEWLGSCGVDVEAGGWQGALGALERLLAEHGVRQGRLQVVLSSCYTRVCLLPWQDSLASPQEQLAYAQVCLEDIYGSQGETWTLRLSPEPQGRPRLVAAMPSALLQGLEALSDACDLRLQSLQPYLMTAFNRFREQLRPSNFFFLLVEPGRCTLLLVRNGVWAAVRSLSGNDSDDALQRLLQRECQLHGDDGPPPQAIYLHAPGRDDSLPGLAGACPLHLPRPKLAQRDPLYVMAQTVI